MDFGDIDPSAFRGGEHRAHAPASEVTFRDVYKRQEATVICFAVQLGMCLTEMGPLYD